MALRVAWTSKRTKFATITVWTCVMCIVITNYKINTEDTVAEYIEHRVMVQWSLPTNSREYYRYESIRLQDILLIDKLKIIQN